jgi:hypothetical protein
VNRRALTVWSPAAGLLVGLAAFSVPCQQSDAKAAFGRRPQITRFTFEFERDTPLDTLLPAPPETASARPMPWNNDLAKVPEVAFGKPIARDVKNGVEQTAHALAKINHLNRQDTDGFLKALLSQREDLRGMPFLLGGECRTDEEQAQLFSKVVRLIRRASFNSEVDELKGTTATGGAYAKAVWDDLTKGISPQALRVADAPLASREGESDPVIEPAIVAALMQIVTPGSEIYGPRLPKHLASIPHVDATRALAKLALFSPDAEVREAAIDALRARRRDEYSGALLDAFHYPLPTAAQRAGEAIAKLGRTELVGNLVEILEQRDPRLPKTQFVNGKNVKVLRELVRVNHQRNCVLCHAPGNTADTPGNVLQGEVPRPADPLPVSSAYYSLQQSPDIMVRVDVTYLRQDFSLVLPVEDSGPWPAEQRFDFFVRKRIISDEEAAEYDRQLRKTPQPYHIAALQALRALTGRYAASPEAWRAWLKRSSPAKSRMPLAPPVAEPPVELAARNTALERVNYTPVAMESGWLVLVSALAGLFVVLRIR